MKLLLGLLLTLPIFAQLNTFVNVGGPMYTDSGGNVWSADTGCASASTWSRGVTINGTADPTLYQTGRSDPSSIGCSYTVTNNQFYYVVLKFAETDPTVTKAGQRLLNVLINSNLLLRNFDTVAGCAALASVCDRTFGPIPVSTGNMSIVVTQVQGQASLQALSIVAVASSFTGAPGGSDTTIQYNSLGTFAGSTNLVYNSGLNQITHQALVGQGSTALHRWLNSSGVLTSQIDASGGFNSFSSGVQKLASFLNIYQLSSDSYIQWKSNANLGIGTVDLALYRNAAGVLEINNGANGTYRDLVLRNLQLNGQAGNGVKCIHTDNSGNLTVAAADCSSGGGISGLTTNKIPKAASSTTIADSSISDDGTTVNITEPVAIGPSPPAVTGTGVIGLGETTGQACVVGADCLQADSGTHRLLMKSNSDTSQGAVVSAASTDTLTNKTFDTAGTGNSFSINGVAVTANTGTGSVVRAASPTLTTPALGVPSAIDLTNASGMPAKYNRHVCDMVVGDTTASALTNSQLGPQKRLCYIPAAATVVEMDVAADAGTPNVIVGKNTAGSILNIVSATLATAASGGIACSNTGGTTGIDSATTCSATLQNTSLAAGAYLELVSGTAGGTAKLMTIHVIYTIN